MEPYVHGYGPREQQRLQDQARTLADLLHAGTAYAAGSRVLEVGCGVGAQTLEIGRRSPGARITSIDVAADSVAEARRRVAAAGLAHVDVLRADLYATPFAPESFDHVFVCFVLEHLADPPAALKRLLKRGGSLTVIEGDHGSTYFHPRSSAADEAVQSLVTLQCRAGGDALIGRRLYPMLRDAGFADVQVTPRMVYVDGSRPALADGFTLNTFTAMVGGAGDAAVAAGLITAERFAAGMRDLARTAAQDGVFCYTFFKAFARRVGIRDGGPAPDEHNAC
jgi:protein-L-isoaspartate O-methyltransferase